MSSRWGELSAKLGAVLGPMEEVENPKPEGQRKQILLRAKKIKDFQKVMKDAKAMQVKNDANPNMDMRAKGLEGWPNRFSPNVDHLFGSVADKIPPVDVWKQHVGKTLLYLERQIEEVLWCEFFNSPLHFLHLSKPEELQLGISLSYIFGFYYFSLSSIGRVYSRG